MMTNAQKLAKDIADDICDEQATSRREMTEIIAARIEPLVQDAERWRYIREHNVAANSPHMDGTMIFRCGNALGRARTVDEAVDLKTKESEATND